MKIESCHNSLPPCRRRFGPLRYSSVALLLTIALVSLACQPPPSDFPALPDKLQQESVPTEPSDATENDEDRFAAKLTVALPIGQEALEMLRLFFVADAQGALGDRAEAGLGQTVSLSDLAAYDQPLELELESVSLEQGAEPEQVKTWLAADRLPDIIYTQQSMPWLKQENALLDLTDYLAKDSRLQADRVFPGLFPVATAQDPVQGIPYLASVPLIFADAEMIDGMAQEDLGDLSLVEFSRLLQRVEDELAATDQDLSDSRLAQLALQSDEQRQEYLAQSKVVFANPLNLIAWLPAQQEKQLAWMAHDGQNFVPGEALAAWRWLATLVAEGKTPYHLPHRYSQEAGFAQPLVQNRRAVFWLDDSSRLPYWLQHSGFAVQSFFLPLQSDSLDLTPEDTSLTQLAAALPLGRMPVDCRFLLVSAHSLQPELAVDLATLIALDADALLIQSRYQLYEGFFPVVRSRQVWQAMVARQPYGHDLMAMREKMASVVLAGNHLGVSRAKAEEATRELWQQTWQDAADSLLSDDDVFQSADALMFMPVTRIWQDRLRSAEVKERPNDTR